MTSDTTAYRLRQLRKQAGLKQWEVAAKVFVTPQMISQYENGRVPTVHMLIDLARLYEVSTDYLLGLSDMPNGHPLERGIYVPSYSLSDRGEILKKIVLTEGETVTIGMRRGWYRAEMGDRLTEWKPLDNTGGQP